MTGVDIKPVGVVALNASNSSRATRRGIEADNGERKITQYLTRSDDIPKYMPIRSKWRCENKPAFLLAVIPGFVRGGF